MKAELIPLRSNELIYRPLPETSRWHFVFDLQLASTSLILVWRSGISPELTGCEQAAFYQSREFKDESIAVEQSGSMSCWTALWA
jgi:hypothetical protein